MEALYLEQWLNGQYEVMRFAPDRVEFVMVMPLRLAKQPLSVEMIRETSQIPEMQYAAGYADLDISNESPAHYLTLYNDHLNRGWKPSKQLYFEQIKKLYTELPNPAN